MSSSGRNRFTLLVGTVALFLLTSLVSPAIVFADAPGDNHEVAVSPIDGWEDFSEKPERTPAWRQALLWPINRIADLWDVFRVDVGVGISVGAVARITRQGQFGARVMNPASFRIGDFGRRRPYLLERTNEFGFGPFYAEPGEREVCRFELGLGADLLILGGYGGICLEELYDFAGGLFLFDPVKDDLK
jgi:hypothetical protein